MRGQRDKETGNRQAKGTPSPRSVRSHRSRRAPTPFFRVFSVSAPPIATSPRSSRLAAQRQRAAGPGLGGEDEVGPVVVAETLLDGVGEHRSDGVGHRRGDAGGG